MVLNPEPAGPHYIERHRQLMDARTAGPAASPSFRAPWSRMDAHWAMVASGDEKGLLITREETSRYRDLAVAAAAMASQDLLNETIDRSGVLRGMRTALRSLTSPSLQIGKSRSDEVVIRASGAPAVQRDAMIAAAIAEPNCPVGEERPARDGASAPRTSGRAQRGEPALQPPGPLVSVGFAGGVTTRTITDSTGSPTGDIELTLRWSAYIQARHLGVDALRISGSVLSWEPLAPSSVVEPFQSGDWSLTVRERFLPRWTALADARSASGSPAVETVQPGLAWQVIGTNPRWYLQGSYTYKLPAGAHPNPESTVALRLLWTGRWSSPAAPDDWPLGHRPGHTGPAWPDEPEPSEHQATALVLTPAERYADTAPSRAEEYALLTPTPREEPRGEGQGRSVIHAPHDEDIEAPRADLRP